MAKTGKGAGVHIALLRGINVGGKHRLPMQDLAAMFRKAGCGNVRTYIQSGNVVYEADAALARRAPAAIEKAIASAFGFPAPVVTRTAAELEAIAAAHPFMKKGVDPRLLHVGFLRDLPAKARVSALDPDRSPPDVYVVRDREVYMCFPKGAGTTKLTSQYFDSMLQTTITARNWNTVLKLLEMSRG